jgi:hypothetical protein
MLPNTTLVVARRERETTEIGWFYLAGDVPLRRRPEIDKGLGWVEEIIPSRGPGPPSSANVRRRDPGIKPDQRRAALTQIGRPAKAAAEPPPAPPTPGLSGGLDAAGRGRSTARRGRCLPIPGIRGSRAERYLRTPARAHLTCPARRRARFDTAASATLHNGATRFHA